MVGSTWYDVRENGLSGEEVKCATGLREVYRHTSTPRKSGIKMKQEDRVFAIAEHSDDNVGDLEPIICRPSLTFKYCLHRALEEQTPRNGMSMIGNKAVEAIGKASVIQ